MRSGGRWAGHVHGNKLPAEGYAVQVPTPPDSGEAASPSPLFVSFDRHITFRKTCCQSLDSRCPWGNSLLRLRGSAEPYWANGEVRLRSRTCLHCFTLSSGACNLFRCASLIFQRVSALWCVPRCACRTASAGSVSSRAFEQFA